MEYTNKLLEDLDLRKSKYNSLFSRYYYKLFGEFGGEIVSVYNDVLGKSQNIGNCPGNEFALRYFNRGRNIESCLNLWLWDLYENNKVLDLKSVNRCKNTRFCPNCKMMNAAKFIHEFNKVMPMLADYDLYMLTVTIPSVGMSENGAELKAGINKLNETFRKLNHKYSRDLYTPTGKISSKAFFGRYFKFEGGIKVLEITYNCINGFHPHLHCIVAVRKDLDKDLLVKKHKGKYSNKRKSFNMKSDVDLQIGKIWTMLFYGIDFRKFDSIDYDPQEKYLKIDDIETEFLCLETDFVELDEGGVYEVFKYTFKSSDVSNFSVFKNLVFALENKRIRQGFGFLYNLKCDEDDFETGELQDLELNTDPLEIPVQLLTQEIKELYTTFRDYKKVSRFEPKNIDKVSESISD